MDRSMPIDAAELVNTLPERELSQLIKQYGEERHARRIASKIVEARGLAPIEATDQLADLIRSAVPYTRGARSSIHPATRTFQALRIAVNDELDDDPSIVNSDPYGAGWMIKLKLADPSEVSSLLSADSYAEHIG